MIAKPAGYRWYKDLCLGICVFILTVVVVSQFFEPTFHLRYLIALLGAIALCLVLATSKTGVIGGALGILFFRGLIAMVLQPGIGKFIGLGASFFSGIMLYALFRNHSDSDFPYDPDSSNMIVNFMSAALGVALAILIARLCRAALPY